MSVSVGEQEDTMSLYQYYVGWFVFLLLLLIVFKKATAKRDNPNVGGVGVSGPVVTAEFKRFQTNYITVFLLMMGADWLQGPYVYALYKHYGYSMGEIGTLFIVGFASSMSFGTMVGSAADKYGRRKLCLLFGVLYAISCMTKHFSSYGVLMVGRFLGGISTSILFSSFEAWMVHEHKASSYPEEWLGDTFATCTSGNGIVAIAAGVVASLVRDRWGPVAPFDASLICLILGTLLVAKYWSENTGDSSIDFSRTFTNALHRCQTDSKIIYLGIIQSFFEGAMYVFVFMWTPALESTSNSPIFHGWIFACFMICTLIGSGLFNVALQYGYQIEKLALSVFTVSAVSLIVPAFTLSHSVRLMSFFVFEVCVGLFWPSLGTMRSRYVPEEVRATVMNFFRIPLNFIVVVVLINIDRLSEFEVFSVCFLCLLPSIFCQWRLLKIINAPRKSALDGLREEQVAMVQPGSH